MNDIVATEQTPDHWIALAIQQGADPDRLEKLLGVQERWQAQQSRRAYYEAMRAVQAEAPAVTRDATNTQTGSLYAKLETISKALAPVYTRHGFSLSYGTADSPLEGYVRITCAVMHSGGHVEHIHVDLPADDVGIKGNRNKTATHAHGSTISYGRRYLVLMAFNVTMAGEDDDGVAGDDAVAKWDRLLKHNAVAREWLESIVAIKGNLAGGDLTIAAEAYAEMPRPVIATLFIAPSKGGLFSTEERARCKDDKEFQSEVHRRRTDSGWYQRDENAI